MAKIVLNVELGQKQVLKDLELLKSGIKNIASSLGDVKVNKDLTAQLNALTKNYNALAKAAQAAQKVNNKQALSEQKLAKATAQASTAKINEQKASVQLETAQIRLTKAQQQGTKTVKTATQANEKHKQSILSMAAGFFEWQLAAAMVMKPLYAIRSAWASINDTLVKTEDAVVSLQRVLNDDSLSGKTISGKLYELAAKYGQTFDNANEIAQNFARTGMDWNETIKATEAALLALNVAELDATQASDGLIAIMQQFGYEASNLTDIIDILNKTADNYAVTTDKLLTALQRTGSSAKNANLSLEQTVGIVTALSEATGRSGENLGTAVNSLIQFSTKSSALDTFANLSDNMATLVEDFRHGKGTVLDIWQGLSAEIKNASGNTENILSGLFGDDDWRSLNAELQEALGEEYSKVTEIYDTASTFRKNYFIALLNNMDTVEKAIGTASDATGYSQKENEKYLDTYTAKVNELNAQWQKLANNEQGVLGLKKALVEIGTEILNIINGIGGIKGVLQTAIAVASPFLANLTIVFGAKALSSLKRNIVSLLTAIKAGAISANAALGILGVALGVIVTAVNAVKSSIEQAEEARKQWIEETNQSSKEAVSSLDNIKTKIGEISQGYLKLANASNEYTKTLTDQEAKQQAIAEQEAKQQAKQYLEENYSKIYNAKKLISNSSYSSNELGRYGFYTKNKALSDKELQEIIKKYSISDIQVIGRVIDDWEGVKSIFGGEYYSTLLKTNDLTLKQQAEVYQKLFEALTQEEAAGRGSEQLSYTKAWLQDAINTLKEQYLSSEELLDSVKPYQDFVDGLISYDEFLKQIGVTIEETTEVVKSWADQSKEVVKNYQDILDIINKTRDTQQAIVDLEEKKKALEDARNNRNVRVYNASTGNWELQADMGAVADAKKAYEDAVLNNLQNELEAGNLTAGEIYEKVKEIAVDLPYLAMTIRDAFVAQGYNMPEYDSGGVLRGLGGIKATSQDEIVLPPDLAKKILQPTTNAEFAQFAKSLGLLFGSSKQIADMKSGMVVNNGCGSSTDNRSYVANGVPFTRETAETHTLVELFEMAANFNN